VLARGLIGALAGVALVAAPGEASFPGANGRLAFSVSVDTEDDPDAGSCRTEHCTDSRIFTVSPRGGRRTAVRTCVARPPSDCQDSAPSWSPHGKRLAFMRTVYPPGYRHNETSALPIDYQPFTSSAAGGQQRRVPGLVGPAVWLGRAQRLLGYGSLPGESGLYSVSPDGTGKRKVLSSGAVRLDVSSRGDLALDRSARRRTRGFAGRDIFLRRRGRKSVSRVTRDGHSTQPSWSPGGRLIAFANSGRRKGLYVIDLRGQRRQRLYGKDFVSHPTWSPDGRAVAFVRQAGGRDSIYAVHADGSRLRRIYRGRGETISGISWRPVDR